MTQKTTLTDLGTTFRATIVEDGVVVDVSSTSAKQIIFKRPGGELLTKTAAFTTDGINGQIEYIRIANDFDQPSDLGKWLYRGKVTFSAGAVFTSVDWIPFEVIE